MELPLQGIPVLSNRVNLTCQNLILIISHNMSFLDFVRFFNFIFFYKLGTELQRK